MQSTHLEPCVKGNALAMLVDEAQRALESGSLQANRLAPLPHDLQKLIEHGALPNEWYPVLYYSLLGELLCATTKLERVEYLRKLGGKDFARLNRARTYRQLDYLVKLDTKRDLGTQLHDARLITSLMTSIFNFSRWGPAPDPKNPKYLVIQVTDAAHIPEVFRFLTEGFQTAMNRGIKPLARAVRSERPRPDLIIFRSIGPKPDGGPSIA
jgi:hypothetical protein